MGLIQGTENRKAIGRSAELDHPDVLRCHWAVLARKRDIPSLRLEMSVAGETFQLKLTLGSHTILEGGWTTTLLADGRELRPTSAWEVVCRHHSSQTSYLELVQFWSEGLRLWRHVLLAREDGWLILGEAFTGSPRQRAWFYQTSLSFSNSDVHWCGKRQTTEGWITHAQGRLARILPIFAPEYKTADLRGVIRDEGLSLKVTSSFSGRAFFAPLWVDWRLSRLTERCTWRQLTVAENGRAVPFDTAAAYRVQVADEHWLFYRSLGPAGKRSFFGHQLLSELFFGRFNRQSGLVTPLLEVTGS
jgi:hypothetical protein